MGGLNPRKRGGGAPECTAEVMQVDVGDLLEQTSPLDRLTMLHTSSTQAGVSGQCFNTKNTMPHAKSLSTSRPYCSAILGT